MNKLLKLFIGKLNNGWFVFKLRLLIPGATKSNWGWREKKSLNTIGLRGLWCIIKDLSRKQKSSGNTIFSFILYIIEPLFMQISCRWATRTACSHLLLKRHINKCHARNQSDHGFNQKDLIHALKAGAALHVTRRETETLLHLIFTSPKGVFC